MLIKIQHSTSYEYSVPVSFGPHRLMLRPLEGHDVQIRSSTLQVTPSSRIRWVHDVFDNSLAYVDFSESSRILTVVSDVVVEQYNTNPFDFVMDTYAVELPFLYPEQDYFDVSHYTRKQFPGDEGVVKEWIRPFLNPTGKTNTLAVLLALNQSVPTYFQYKRREEYGVQSPAQTLQERSGSCRDFALLLMEAARSLGLAARFVSGYACQTGATPAEATASTHAWTEIYLPGAGWKGFDPTGGVLAADLHIRAAVAREPAQAAPISGCFIGDPSAFKGMTVAVKVEIVPPSAVKSSTQSNAQSPSQSQTS
ncbi:MAG: transglutaminase domain protein [Verrucomicrobiales bacterium]|nr:transglutaminase domain protein [Verrucomicrobiales bacterium]